MNHLPKEPRIHSDDFFWKKNLMTNRTQGFSRIWPSDLEFDKTWPTGIYVKTEFNTSTHHDKNSDTYSQ
jgi:hypothetical protein